MNFDPYLYGLKTNYYFSLYTVNLLAERLAIMNNE